MTRIMRRGRRDEEGFTLIEVLVAATLTVGLLFTMLGFIQSTHKSARQGIASTDDVNTVRQASFAMTKSIRAAAGPTLTTPAVVSGDDDSIVFYSNINSGTSAGITAPNRYSYALQSSSDGLLELVETILRPDAGSNPPAYTGAGGQSSRVLARRIVREANQPVFRYLDISGNRLGTDNGTEYVLATADLPRVTSIQVRAAVQSQTNPGVTPTVVTNQVRLSNAYYQDND